MNKPFICKVSYDHIPSINTAYTPRRGGGLMLSDEARQYKTTIKNCLWALNVDWATEYPWMYDDPWLSLDIHFLFNTSFDMRDCDNCIKQTVDALSEWSEINDRNILSISAKKFYIPESPKEYVIFIYQPCDANYMEYHEKMIRDANKSR